MSSTFSVAKARCVPSGDQAGLNPVRVNAAHRLARAAHHEEPAALAGGAEGDALAIRRERRWSSSAGESPERSSTFCPVVLCR